MNSVRERGLGIAVAVLVIAALFISLTLVRIRMDVARGVMDADKELLYLPDWRILHAFALGDDQTAADLLWIRGVFYIAAQRFEEIQKERSARGWFSLKAVTAGSGALPNLDFSRNPAVRRALFWNYGSSDAKDLSQLIANVNRLDSKFVTPYVQGALILAMMAGRPNEAREVLDRGIKELPDRWELPYYRGFIRLFFQNDRIGAADDIQTAAAKPGAIPIVIELATVLRASLSGPEMAVGFLKSLSAISPDAKMRQQIEALLKQYSATNGGN